MLARADQLADRCEVGEQNHWYDESWQPAIGKQENSDIGLIERKFLQWAGSGQESINHNI